MLNKEIINKMNEIFEQENTLYKGVCSTSLFWHDVNIWDIQKELNNFNYVKGIEVSPKLYLYLDSITKEIASQINIVNNIKTEPQTLYGYPIAIDINLKNYEYKIMGKEND